MDIFGNKRYYDKKAKDKDEVVKMVTVPQTRITHKETKVTKVNDKAKYQSKKSAIEISNQIGIYGAFGRTLSDLHKQGR